MTEDADVYDYAIKNNLVKADKDGTIYKRYASGEMGAVEQVNKTDGYNVVSVTINGKPRILVAHRIVAKTYIPNPENKPQVNHIDGNKSNNRVDNLEWCTAKENAKHAFEVLAPNCPYCGVSTIARGGVCPKCRYRVARSEREESRANLNRIRKDLKYVNLEKLRKKDKEIIELRKSGKSYKEIGELKGFSRQRAHQLIKKIIESHQNM